MTVTARAMTLEDAPVAGEIIAVAFNTVFQQHNFPPPFPSIQTGQLLASLYAQYPESQGFVAEQDGRIVGCGFVHIRGDRAGIGPVTVDPRAQAAGVGRAIMLRLLEEAKDCTSVRLLQDAFNNVSFSLYTKLGFVARDIVPLLVSDDPRPQPSRSPAEIRPMTAADLDDVASLDTEITGLRRRRDFELLLGFGTHLVCERDGRINGYLCRILANDTNRLGPAAAQDGEDLKALLHHAAQLPGPRAAQMRFLASQDDLLRYAFEAGFVVSNIGTYMVKGDWQPFQGAQIIAMFPEAL